MRKLVLATACSLVALVGVATPAHAKGPMLAVLEAPGAEPIVLRHGGSAADPFYELQDQVGFWTAMSPTMGSDGGTIVVTPTGDLGPMLRLRWDDPDATAAALGTRARHGGPNLVQELYPWAAGGPVGFVPAGQQTYDERSVATWYRLDDDLPATLAELGMADRATLAAAEPLEPTVIDPKGTGTVSAEPAPAGSAPSEGPIPEVEERATDGATPSAAATDARSTRAPADDDVPWVLVAAGALGVTGVVVGGGRWARRRRGRDQALGTDVGLPSTGATA